MPFQITSENKSDKNMFLHTQTIWIWAFVYLYLGQGGRLIVLFSFNFPQIEKNNGDEGETDPSSHLVWKKKQKKICFFASKKI